MYSGGHIEKPRGIVQGCNLDSCRDRGDLVIVDVLSQQTDWSAPDSLKILYTQIRGAVISLQGNGAPVASPGFSAGGAPGETPAAIRCAVFLDGVSTLGGLVDETGGSFSSASPGRKNSTLGGGVASQWTAFLYYLVLLGQNREPGSASCVVMLIHDENEADELWHRTLDIGSDTIVAVHPLESGHSAEVGGEMTIFRRTEPVLSTEEAARHSGLRQESLTSFYFRTSDIAVNFLRTP